MKLDYAIIGYPLSDGFRCQLEDQIGNKPVYLQIQDVRQQSLWGKLKLLAGLPVQRLFLVCDAESSRRFVSVFYALASLTRAKEIHLVQPTLETKRVSRWSLLKAIFGTIWATVQGRFCVRRCRREVAQLLQAPRVEVPIPADQPASVLYLKTNMSVGVKAGGSVGHVAGVINGLVGFGIDVQVASLETPPMLSPQVRYHPILPPSATGLPHDMNFYRYQEAMLQQVQPLPVTRECAFIYQRLSVANYAGTVLSRWAGKPLVVEYNGSEVWVAKNWGSALYHHDLAEQCEQVMFKHAHLIVTVSEVLVEELVQRGVSRDRIVCYPNCIDPQVFDPALYQPDQLQQLRDKHGIARDTCVVSFVGTFGKWHGVEVLAEAIRRLAFEQADWLRAHRVHFLIVGDGQLMPNVKEILADERCRPFYTLTGLVPQESAPAYVAMSDVMLSPHVPNPDGTRFFGSPTKLFEYMAMAKPIIASKLEQIGDILHTGLTPTELAQPADPAARPLAVYIQPGSVEDLILGVQKLVEAPGWQAVLGANARQEALAHYTWKHHVQAILSGLSKLAPARN